MTVENITSMVSTIGFPAFVCIALMAYIMWEKIQRRKDFAERRQTNEETIRLQAEGNKALAEAINGNTETINYLKSQTEEANKKLTESINHNTKTIEKLISEIRSEKHG